MLILVFYSRVRVHFEGLLMENNLSCKVDENRKLSIRNAFEFERPAGGRKKGARCSVI